MPLFGKPNVEKLKARRDIAGLVEALAYKKDWNVRKAAARALGEICDPRGVVEPILNAIHYDESQGVREAAIEALKKLADYLIAEKSAGRRV